MEVVCVPTFVFRPPWGILKPQPPFLGGLRLRNLQSQVAGIVKSQSGQPEPGGRFLEVLRGVGGCVGTFPKDPYLSRSSRFFWSQSHPHNRIVGLIPFLGHTWILRDWQVFVRTFRISRKYEGNIPKKLEIKCQNDEKKKIYWKTTGWSTEVCI